MSRLTFRGRRKQVPLDITPPTVFGSAALFSSALAPVVGIVFFVTSSGPGLLVIPIITAGLPVAVLLVMLVTLVNGLQPHLAEKRLDLRPPRELAGGTEEQPHEDR
jgi:hypothetical protein